MTTQAPFFSVIIPTRNRPERLAECLEALARLDYPRDRFEVIVVDDCSEILPEVVVGAFRDRLDVRLLVQPRGGPASARNTGAASSKGEFLAFIDDDCAPARDWLSKLAASFGAMPRGAIGGRTVNALSDNQYSNASQMLVDYLYTYYNTAPDQASFFASNNLIVPAERFYMLGGFDTTFAFAGGEDRELCDRWLQHGHRLTYAPDALIYHSHRLTLHTFWKQHFFYGRGAFNFHQVRAQRGHERIKLEPLSFYVNLVCCPFSQGWSVQALWLATLLVMSQVANAAGFIWEGANQITKLGLRCRKSKENHKRSWLGRLIW